ncbi:MAG: divalent metal cation transporter [Armatimonadetes bacterium]|nr:divalent metal cation transporter [Armatimonadota bacterium]
MSTIARYQLLNERGETVLEGLARLHPFFPPFVAISTLALCHGVNVYMYQGLGESCRELAVIFGAPGEGGPVWAWAVGWAILFWALLKGAAFQQIERIFLVFLAILSLCLLTAAVLARPDLGAILRGTLGFQLPEQRGAFDPSVVALSLVGAVAGSLANLMYPYLMREKGWTTPAHRKVQQYDLALGILVIIVLDLAVWAVGAEVLHPRGLTVSSTQDLAGLLSQTLGTIGGILIYLGIFAAVGSSLVGNALGYSSMATHAVLLWRPELAGGRDYRAHPLYHALVLFALFTPLVWVVLGRSSFVPLTVTLNAFQVFLLPVLAAGIWILTASARFIGAAHRNSLGNNLALGAFFLVAFLGMCGAGKSLLGNLFQPK